LPNRKRQGNRRNHETIVSNFFPPFPLLHSNPIQALVNSSSADDGLIAGMVTTNERQKMNNDNDIANRPPDRRAFLKRAAATLAGLGALTAFAPKAQAAFGAGNVPTELLLSVTPSARLSAQITVAATLRRLDGSSAGLAGHQIQFWAGAGTYAPVNLGRYVLLSNGTLRFSFAARNMRVKGNYVLIADFNPNSCSDGWIAAPRPYARFTVTA
jgi:hypothetical protein